ncbi:MAG: amidohydrolase family protein [Alphaproteobacteria bacterium]|jgi:imidazolonepropionase-like amidohydrolase|nr:amidohydrolase family protein [Alphaproteobacteria bacterium]|tara:strand:- start:800 stop:2125 length:1326 start_codon:yes stop_codon:yes gene_type:complete
MLRLIGFLLICLSVPAAAQEPQEQTQTSGSTWTIIHAGTLLTRPGKRPLERQSVIIRKGLIEAVRTGYATAADLAGNGLVRIIDLSDKFVLPGLIDCHTHLEGEWDAKVKLRRVEQTEADVALDAAFYALRTLEAGFTTVRNTGATTRAIFALRNAINAGKVPGPRIIAAGQPITVTGGHGETHGYVGEVLDTFLSTGTCDGADDCRRAVRLQVKRGADVIKITATGGVLSETAAGTDQQFTDAELEAIVETAHALGRKVAAHAHGTDGINAALRAGVDSIDHGSFTDESSIKLFKRTGAYLVPTVVAGVTVIEMAEQEGFFPPPIRAKAIAVGAQLMKMLGQVNKAGVKIAFGTDAGVSPHGGNAREFLLMVDAGMTPMESIVAATINAADLLGLSDEIGTIEPGKAADLVATDASPLADIAELSRIAFVMKSGEVYRQD